MPMFRIHREGQPLLVKTFLVLGLIALALAWWSSAAAALFGGFALLALLFMLAFFRHPYRPLALQDDRLVYAPADGRIVVVEETEQSNYFEGPRLQISIFMSLANVHVNRHPVGGEIVFFQYHPGLYLVAWHPKSSLENERTTLVYQTPHGKVLLRQIAGALARRIITYPRLGDRVEQGGELGFIRFGSRVDLLLPPDAEVLVEVGQRVRGNETVLARF